MSKTFKVILVLTLCLFLGIGCSIISKKSAPFSIETDTKINHELIGESQHFIIYSDIPEEDGNYYARTLESLYDYTNDHFFSIKNTEKLKVVLLFKKSNEVSNSTTLKPLSEGPLYGYYSNGVASIDMNLGLGTVGHEVIHYFTSTYKKNLSMFASEGIATYFEKFVGYVDQNNGTQISFGYLHPRRITNAIERLSDVTLSNVISSKEHADNDLSYSFMLFMQRRGLLKSYITQRLTTDRSDKQIIESLFSKSISDIDPEWRSWLMRQSNTQELELVRVSFMCKSAAEFRSWINKNKLVWNQSLLMYEVAK